MVALKRWLAALGLALAACAGTPGAIPAGESGGIVLVAPDLPRGARVAVTGSFNAWSSEGPTMSEEAPGSYRIELELPPGIHRLQLVVREADGTERWMVPPGLERYEPDGFGGENGVIEIGGSRNLRAAGSFNETK